MVGLILIAFGTGGIKPCVAAFGGDQFDKENVRRRASAFSFTSFGFRGHLAFDPLSYGKYVTPPPQQIIISKIDECSFN